MRVSRVGDREGERFVSPKEQAERIRSAAERDGLELVETIEDLDVSGGAPLAKRDGVRRAVEARGYCVRCEFLSRIGTRYRVDACL